MRSLLAALLLAVSPTLAAAQPANSLGEPILVVNVAGVDRVLDDVRWIFESVDRDDLVDGVETVLTAVNGLKGVDRSKPLGIMAFAAAAGAGQPIVVGYVPVTDLDELMGSLTVGPFRPERVPGVPGRWRIAGPEQPNEAVHLEARDGYAWIVRDPKLFDVKYPDPVETTRTLTERYDVAASFNMAGLPAGLRFLASAGLGQVARQATNRRDDETPEQHALRKRLVESMVATANQFLADGRDLVVGWEFSRERKDVRVEWAANAQPDSKLAETLARFRGAPSRFTGAFGENDPLVFSTSWRMGDALRDIAVDGVGLARRQALAEAAASNDGPPAELLGTAFDVLEATAAAGHVDVAFRATGSPPGNMVLLGMVGVQDGEKLTTVFDAALTAAEGEAGGTITRNALEHGGVTLHRLQPNDVDDGQRRLFGPKPSIYVGHDARTIWFAMGGRNVEASLKQAIGDGTEKAVRVGDPPPGTVSETGDPVVLFDAGAATMILLADERDAEFDAIAQKAFLPGGDRIRIALGPKPDGVALNVTFGEGWVRLLGLGMAQGFDESR